MRCGRRTPSSSRASSTPCRARTWARRPCNDRTHRCCWAAPLRGLVVDEVDDAADHDLHGLRVAPGLARAIAHRLDRRAEVSLGSVKVPVRGPLFSLDEAYKAKLTVPAFKLPEENPDDDTQSGTYKIVVTTFLDSTLGPVGYDMMGYAEGPIIKVENPL